MATLNRLPVEGQMNRTATGASQHEIEAYVAEMQKRVEHYRIAAEQHEQEAGRYRVMLEATLAAIEVFNRPMPDEAPSEAPY